MVETAQKLSPTPLHKHLLCGCTVDVPPLNYHRWSHIVSPRDTFVSSCSLEAASNSTASVRGILILSLYLRNPGRETDQDWVKMNLVAEYTMLTVTSFESYRVIV